MECTPEQAAEAILQTIPVLMDAIRAHMRSRGTAVLSMPQFRTLVCLQTRSDASLSDTAEFVGLTLPSMSKLIDGLVARGLLSRQTHTQDRRRITLALTDAGQTSLDKARQEAQACLAEILARRSEPDRLTIVNAMSVLRPAFMAEPRQNGRHHTNAKNIDSKTLEEKSTP